MMNHPQAEDVPGLSSGMEEAEEEEDHDDDKVVLDEEEEEEEMEEDEAEDSESADDEEADGDHDAQIVSKPVADTLRLLCGLSSEAAGLAEKSGKRVRRAEVLESVLTRAEVPESSWSEVCGVVTQLAALGLLRVSSAQPKQGKRRKAMKGQRGREQHSGPCKE